METEKSMLWIVSIVAVVAIVAIVMLLSSGNTQKIAPVPVDVRELTNAGGDAKATSPNLYGCKDTGWVCYSTPVEGQAQQKGHYWSCNGGIYKCVINGDIAY